MRLFGDVLRGGFRILLSPDGDPTVSDPPPDTENDKRFSQKDLEHHVGNRLKKLKQELQAKDETISSLTKRLEDIEAQLTSKGTPDPEKGTWEVTQKKMQAQIDSLTQLVEQHKKDAENAKREKEISERDARLRSLLREAGAIDPDKAAFRFIYPDLVKDDDEWVIRMPNGSTAQITKDVLADILPDNMKSSELRGGGSGSHAAGAKRKQRESELKLEEDKLAELEKQCRAQPQNNTLFIEKNRQKRKVESLRAAINS